MCKPLTVKDYFNRDKWAPGHHRSSNIEQAITYGFANKDKLEWIPECYTNLLIKNGSAFRRRVSAAVLDILQELYIEEYEREQIDIEEERNRTLLAEIAQ